VAGSEACCRRRYARVPKDRLFLAALDAGQSGVLKRIGAPSDRPMLVVRPHLAVSHEGVSRAQLGDAFRRLFRASARHPPAEVHVKPFYSFRTAQDNAGYTLMYTLKHRQGPDPHDPTDWTTPWPPELRAEYWIWLFEKKNGVRPLRIERGMRGRDRNSPGLPCAANNWAEASAVA
jgi:hypothetical protein